ncbi:MAG: hypothetical protein ACLQUZ_05485 [Rhizomicrobium sp.]
MPKLTAPHRASWRGCVLDIAEDGTVEVSDDAASELAAHGFRAKNPEAQGARVPVAAMSRKELIAFIRVRGGGNPITLSNDALREAVVKIQAQEG